MKLATFTHNSHTQIGQIVDDRIYATAWMDTMQHMIRRGITPNRTSNTFALRDVKLEAPLRPPKIVAIGRNYADHAAETGSAVPKAPLIFAKFPTSVIGHGGTVTWSEAITTQVDWEGELAVVIGRRTRNVGEDEALKAVFGYTIANDVTARDLQLRTDSQWTRGKSLDTFCPLGPWIVTADEVPDPHALSIKTTVNDAVVQDSTTGDMIFKIPMLIAYCSKMFTLEPGDILLTGTPPGVGEGHKPPVYLKDGDVMTVTIDGIGELTNPCRVVKAEE
ncbi:MAG: fumarylacetoacetate hydrolase family protein [Chloroflexi bacterium]|nr:fumarylacetoacetate hydrolase family protein [Chloroflexota bacterium]